MANGCLWIRELNEQFVIVIEGRLQKSLHTARFGRNYSEAGKLLAETLPAYGCRIIAIVDDVDSFKDAEATMSIMVRIKNLIHDHNTLIVYMFNFLV